MKKVILCLFLPLLVFSCERDVEIASPDYRSKLFVNAVINNQEDIRIRVGYSVPLLSDSAPGFLQDAALELYRNDTLRGSFTYDAFEKWHSLNEKAIPGAAYRLVVTHPSYGRVTSATRVPSNTGIGNPTYIDSVGLDSVGAKLSAVRFSIADPVADRNFYRLSLEYYNPATQSFLPFEFSTNDPILLGPQTIREDDGSFTFNDDIFNGRFQQFEVQFSSTIITSSPKVLLKIESMNEDYYRYRSTLSRYRENVNQPFSEPVVIYSNVQNGLGIFGAYLLEQDTIY